MCQMGAVIGVVRGNLPPRSFTLSSAGVRNGLHKASGQASPAVSGATAYPVKLAWTGPCACDISRRFRQVQQAPGAHSGVRRAAQ